MRSQFVKNRTGFFLGGDSFGLRHLESFANALGFFEDTFLVFCNCSSEPLRLVMTTLATTVSLVVPEVVPLFICELYPDDSSIPKISNSLLWFPLLLERDLPKAHYLLKGVNCLGGKTVDAVL